MQMSHLGDWKMLKSDQVTSAGYSAYWGKIPFSALIDPNMHMQINFVNCKAPGTLICYVVINHKHMSIFERQVAK